MSNAKNNLALAVKSHRGGQLKEAEALYRTVLKEEPANSVAIANLGVMANQLGKHDQAVGYLKKALQLNPKFVACYNHMGNALIALKRPEEGIRCYREAIRLHPEFVEALYNLGSELGKLGQQEESVELLTRVIKLRPEFTDAYNALGAALDRQGKPALAVQAYQQAIKQRPDFALAHNNLGNTLLAMGMPAKAVVCYEQAIKLKENFHEAIFNMGNAVAELGRLQEAIDAFRQVAMAKPELAEARFNYTRALQNACDWRVPEASEHDFKSYLYQSPGRVDPFFMLSQDSTHADQLFCAKTFAARSDVPPARVLKHAPKKTGGKIRIAYISGNFHQHPNTFLSVGMFEHHDRERFEVYGYSYGADDGSDARKRVIKSFDKFFDIQKLTYEQAAHKIHADGINILIDRQGFTTRHRMGILAYRPAPVQVNYLGYPGTMGADYLDYIIADKVCVPLSEQPHFSEKILHMPECYQSTDSRQEVAEHIPTRAECGLPEDAFVFCCFNNTHKIRPPFFDAWMRLLHAVPGSVLWLLNKNALVKENLCREAEARGIDASRLIFAPPMKHAEHLARHHCADLFLDTLAYNAHTTASDALWVGLPVLTCMGTTFAGRVAASILEAIDLPELITDNLPDYEKLAIELATKPKKLAALKKKLLAKRSTASLFDTARYTRNIEELYIQMWDEATA